MNAPGPKGRRRARGGRSACILPELIGRRMIGLWLVGLGLAGCVSTGPSVPRIPRFDEPLPAPVAIQVLDRRPPKQTGEASDEDWIYYTRKPDTHAEALGRLLGTALTSMGGVPGYSYVRPDFAMEKHDGYGIRVYYQNGYARWPANPNQNRDQVPVEGVCELKVEMWSGGKKTATLNVAGSTAPFQVPVSIITRHNVRRIVGDALIHQYNKAVEDTLDVLLPRMADRWQDYRAGTTRGASSSPGTR